MAVAIVTGAAGLIGSEACLYFGGLGFQIVGIDNDMRRVFFGAEGSTAWNRERLQTQLGGRYYHCDLDVRDRAGISKVFEKHGPRIDLVIHCASQPSHDWAAKEPFTDFDINAVGTLNLLEATRAHCPDAVFIFTSTNKVYGDTPNTLPLVEHTTRYEIAPGHTYAGGIREDMSIDTSLHSVFGASKTAADVMVQEYGRYFGMKTVCFRGGTLSGPSHSATRLHGFLAYLMRCTLTGTHYTVMGYKGKQVRDAIHSDDLIRAFHEFYKKPGRGEVYNIGGGRFSNCSVLEGIDFCQQIAGRRLSWSYEEKNRIGDHIWWIGDNGKFAAAYPDWQHKFGIERILSDICDANRARWQ